MPAKLPGEHSLGCVLPPPHHDPTGQLLQTGWLLSASTSLYVPGVHDAGNSSVLARGQKLPSPHCLHWIAPVSFWNQPASQGMQSCMRS